MKYIKNYTTILLYVDAALSPPSLRKHSYSITARNVHRLPDKLALRNKTPNNSLAQPPSSRTPSSAPARPPHVAPSSLSLLQSLKSPRLLFLSPRSLTAPLFNKSVSPHMQLYNYFKPLVIVSFAIVFIMLPLILQMTSYVRSSWFTFCLQ